MKFQQRCLVFGLVLQPACLARDAKPGSPPAFQWGGLVGVDVRVGETGVRRGAEACGVAELRSWS